MHRTSRCAMAATVLLAACSGGETSEDEIARFSDCIPNTTAPCLCVNGLPGVQSCEEDGSYSVCTCPEDCGAGLVVQGGACADIDECTAGLGTCDANAECRNTYGGYSCVCNAGYQGDGVACADVNECALGTHDCDANATCANVPGSFTCACNQGYEGDGVFCDDIDECALGTDTCPETADCSNSEPGFACVCKSGYTGDGYTCLPDRDTYVADVSTMPIEVSFGGLGVAFRLEGLSRIGYDIEVAEVQGQGARVMKTPRRLIVPDITMRRLRGTPTQTAALSAWLQKGTAAPATDVIVRLKGFGDEYLLLHILSVQPAGGDPTLAADAQGTFVTEAVLRVSTAAKPFEVLEHSNYTGYVSCPQPGQKIEIEGVAFDDCYAEGVLAVPAANTDAPVALPWTRDGRQVVQWAMETMRTWFYPAVGAAPLLARRAGSVITVGANGAEVRRVNYFEAFVGQIDFFNPTRPYAGGYLIDVVIFDEFVENG